jgi:chromosome segregation ATPase
MLGRLFLMDDLAQLLADESESHLTTTAKYVEAVETLKQREEMLENLQTANHRLTDLVVRLEPRTEFQEEQIANLLITVEEKEAEIAELREDQETAAKEHAAALAEQDQRIANLQIRNRDSDIAVQEMCQELRNLHKELGNADYHQAAQPYQGVGSGETATQQGGLRGPRPVKGVGTPGH